jgi:hypothetical protein
VTFLKAVISTCDFYLPVFFFPKNNSYASLPIFFFFKHAAFQQKKISGPATKIWRLSLFESMITVVF